MSCISISLLHGMLVGGFYPSMIEIKYARGKGMLGMSFWADWVLQLSGLRSLCPLH